MSEMISDYDLHDEVYNKFFQNFYHKPAWSLEDSKRTFTGFLNQLDWQKLWADYTILKVVVETERTISIMFELSSSVQFGFVFFGNSVMLRKRNKKQMKQTLSPLVTIRLEDDYGPLLKMFELSEDDPVWTL